MTGEDMGAWGRIGKEGGGCGGEGGGCREDKWDIMMLLELQCPDHGPDRA